MFRAAMFPTRNCRIFSAVTNDKQRERHESRGWNCYPENKSEETDVTKGRDEEIDTEAKVILFGDGESLPDGIPHRRSRCQSDPA
ncbi:MAG: hypothetical protein AAF733_09400 [Verrucomicrobiota bacterium]